MKTNDTQQTVAAKHKVQFWKEKYHRTMCPESCYNRCIHQLPEENITILRSTNNKCIIIRQAAIHLEGLWKYDKAETEKADN